MIFGYLDREGVAQPDILSHFDKGHSTARRFLRGPAGLIWCPSALPTLAGGFAQTGDRHLALVWEGYLSNESELRSQHPDLRRNSSIAELLLRSFEKHGRNAPARWEGKFAVAIWDESESAVRLIRDRVGAEPLFYYNGSKYAAFGSSIAPLTGLPGAEKRLCHEALYTYLLLCYNPFSTTFIDGILKAEPGRVTSLLSSGTQIHPYWTLDFAAVGRVDADALAAGLQELMQKSVASQLAPDAPVGTLLSGGMDSSSVLALMRRRLQSPIFTYSFRCHGNTFDESRYARIMSTKFGTRHTEVEFPAAAVCRIAEMVRFMDEPFCDSGIEVASYLLGEQAAGTVSYVLTGDGGDELFGGHPVYIADKAARIVDAIPRPLMAPAMRLFTFLPDSDQKKNLVVKLKRFAESWAFGSALGSHRWRIYYSLDALHWLASPALWHEFSELDPLDQLRATYKGSAGSDLLGRSLFSDWQTVVRFAVRRQDMVRAFKVEPRFPFYEANLIAYSSKIPSRLKIRGWSKTKYIQHKAMESVLPDEIINRKDKLGHSVPLKNWIRDEPVVGDFLKDVLSNSAISRRGLLNPAAIQAMLSEHNSRRANHAHRLWAIATLELWLNEHLQ